jgi:hypothetical protein
LNFKGLGFLTVEHVRYYESKYESRLFGLLFSVPFSWSIDQRKFKDNAALRSGSVAALSLTR